MTLYDELNDLVNSGTTTWEEIISEIIKVKTETKLSCYQEWMIDEGRCDFDTEQAYDDNSLIERKIMYEQLSKEAKSIVEYLGEILDPVAVKNQIEKIINKRFGWGRKKTKEVIAELREYCRNLDCYS